MAQWIFDIDSEKIVTHPDHFVVEGTHPHVSERILDSDGGIELEMAVFEKYRRQAFGPLYRWNDGYHMTPQGIRDRADADNSDYTSTLVKAMGRCLAVTVRMTEVRILTPNRRRIRIVMRTTRMTTTTKMTTTTMRNKWRPEEAHHP